MKLYVLNTFALMVSMTNIDNILKIILLSVSIGYTINKWIALQKNNKK
jgi:hypothetical protein